MTSRFDLDQRLADWAAQGLWRHLCAVALIVVVAVVRWHHCVLLDQALIDEETYLAAFRAKADGGSPYEIGSYHYTPFFAWIGAKLLTAQGELATLGALRVSSLVGLAIAVWCSLAWFAVSWPVRLTLALAFVALAPGVGAGLCTGNISFAVIGVILVALIHWRSPSYLRGPLPSGLALGATVAAKPLAPLALVALFFYRPPEPVGKRHQVAGIVGGLTAIALLLPMISRIGEMAAQPIHRLSYARSFSLQRWLSLLGLEVSAVAVLAGVGLALVILLRSLRLDRSQLLAVAVTASILATPIVWNHTLLLSLPVQVMALAVATGRWRKRGSSSVPGSAGIPGYELVLVALGALAIQLSGGVGAVDALHPVAQIVFIALPCFAPAALTAYVWFWTRPQTRQESPISDPVS